MLIRYESMQRLEVRRRLIIVLANARKPSSNRSKLYLCHLQTHTNREFFFFPCFHFYLECFPCFELLSLFYCSFFHSA